MEVVIWKSVLAAIKQVNKRHRRAKETYSHEACLVLGRDTRSARLMGDSKSELAFA